MMMSLGTGKMAMVDGGRGITNLHVPSDIIIDNSMPTAIRDGGKMWNTEDKQEDFLATIPDRGYGCTFDEVVKFCQKHGAFDPKTMGCCPNVGLGAEGRRVWLASKYFRSEQDWHSSNRGQQDWHSSNR